MRMLLVSLLVLGTGCSTVHDWGNGRVVNVITAEQRSPFGTNMGFALAQDCAAVVVPEEGIQPIFPSYTYTDCRPLTGWVPMSSQGQGGQIVQGVLNAAGLVGLGAVMGNSTTTVNSSANSAASSTATGGSIVNGAGRGHGH